MGPTHDHLCPLKREAKRSDMHREHSNVSRDIDRVEDAGRENWNEQTKHAHSHQKLEKARWILSLSIQRKCSLANPFI